MYFPEETIALWNRFGDPLDKGKDQGDFKKKLNSRLLSVVGRSSTFKIVSEESR